MSSMSTVWEDTNGCENQYRCALDMQLIIVLLSLYGIIMDCAINAPVHGKNVFDGINATEKIYLKRKCNLLVNYP